MNEDKPAADPWAKSGEFLFRGALLERPYEIIEDDEMDSISVPELRKYLTLPPLDSPAPPA